MKYKKWGITLIIFIFISLAAFAGIMYWMDPFLRYGPEKEIFPYYEYAEMYSNPGIARQYDYDAVLVGTSMIENTDVDLCEELLNCSMVRLPYSGGTTYNMKTILDVCFDSGNDIRSIYWELDEFQLTGSATGPRYPLPDYLYQKGHKEDASYLLNLDIFYHYCVNNLLGMLRGEQQPAARRGETLDGNFSAAATLSGYQRPMPASQKITFEDSRLKKKVDANLQNITALLEAHPTTDFTFFLPPFSVLYWDRELQNGTFDATMDSLIYAVEHLLSYDNVQIHFFQNETDIITNLDNYKDYSHYGSWINNRITQYISEGRNQMTTDNCKDMIDEMRQFIHHYNFDAIFTE